MKKLIWTIAAGRDMERLHSFIAKNNKNAAKRAANAIVHSARLLQKSPRMGVLSENKASREHSVAFAKTGYIVRYMIDGNHDIVILRVYHQKENR